MPHSSSSPRIADSSSPVSAFSARCDWNNTIAAAINAIALNSPKSALRNTGGLPVNYADSTTANPTTRLTT